MPTMFSSMQSDRNHIGLGRVTDTLRVAQPVEPVNGLSAFKIDNIHRAVAEFRHEQPFAREIDRHVIDAAGDAGERDRAFQHQRSHGVGGAAGTGERTEQDR